MLGWLFACVCFCLLDCLRVRSFVCAGAFVCLFVCLFVRLIVGLLVCVFVRLLLHACVICLCSFVRMFVSIRVWLNYMCVSLRVR